MSSSIWRLRSRRYWQQVQDSLTQPVGYKADTTDAAILWYGIDRNNRQKTGEARVPNGTFPGVKESLGVVPQAAREHHAVCQVVRRRPARPPAEGRQHGRLPVGADDLDALAAAHHADSRGEGARGISERPDVGRPYTSPMARTATF